MATKSNIPLKLEGTNGDLKEMSPTEENYLVYQAGLHLKDGGVNSAGILKAGDNGGTLIGTFVDTFYNEADGTHPVTAITSGQTSYNLRQIRNGAADTNGTHYRRPIGFHNGDFYEMNDSDMGTLSNRLLSRIETSEYPGAFRMGTSAPSADWAEHTANIFTDTLGNYALFSLSDSSSIKW